MIDIAVTFEKFEDDFLKFDEVTRPDTLRPDIQAFKILDTILPPKPNRLGRFNDMIAVAEHDQIWLDVDVEELAKVASEENIRDLARCGVFYSEDTESLSMFV